MAKIFYARVDEFWRKEEKYAYLDEKQHRGNIEWQEIKPDAKHNWLTEGMRDEFEDFIPIGTKEAKASSKLNTQTIFDTYGRGVGTSRDSWVYNFDRTALANNVQRIIATYNAAVLKWKNIKNPNKKTDSFVEYDNHEIAWSRDLKNDLQRGRTAEFSEDKIRPSLYRPFAKSNLFFDRVLNEEVYVFPAIFPNRSTQDENLVICVSDAGFRSPFSVLTTNTIANLHLCATSDL